MLNRIEINRDIQKIALRKAVVYTLTLFPRLICYIEKGRYHIDNNAIERAIRPIAIGRKNYLFCGNHNAANDTALFYSLIGSCRLAGAKPHAYFTYIFDNLKEWMDNRLEELIPSNWAERNKE